MNNTCRFYYEHTDFDNKYYVPSGLPIFQTRTRNL